MLSLGIAIFATAGSSSAAPKLECYEDPRTNATTCIDAGAVRESSPGIRYAPLYTGGPREVDTVGHELHTNCATGVTHLKDRRGVSFGGGNGTETAAVRALRLWLCKAPLKNARK